MTTTPPLSRVVDLDLLHGIGRDEVFDTPPLRSSRAAGWSGLYYERWRARAVRTPMHFVRGHLVSVMLDRVATATRVMGGRSMTELQRRGCVALVPDGTPHEVGYQDEGAMVAHIVVDVDRVEQALATLGRAGQTLYPAFAMRVDPFLLSTAEALDAEVAEGHPHGPAFAHYAADAIAWHLAVQFTRHRHEPAPLDRRTRERMRAVSAYIDQHLSLPILLDDLARVAGLSVFHFCRTFKRCTGSSPYRYVLLRRLERAQQLLREGTMSLQAVATTCGWSDGVQFGRAFRRHCGMSPTTYLRHHVPGSDPLPEAPPPVRPVRATGEPRRPG